MGIYGVRADFNASTIVVYQAYPPRIAEPALERQRFVAPFSFERMTWIKPSFLWLMERSRWGQASGQERILGVRISRAGWEEALAQGVLTSPEKGIYSSAQEWDRRFREAAVHIQWDPERSLRGAKLSERSIQVGIGSRLIERFASEWVVAIEDLSPRVAKLHKHRSAGEWDRARALLPPEREYPLPEEIRRMIEPRS